MDGKSILDLNQDCELLIRKEIEKLLINYVSSGEIQKVPLEITDITSQLNMELPEMRQLYLSSNQTIATKERVPKMLPSSSAMLPTNQSSKTSNRRSFVKEFGKRFVDTQIQASDERCLTPRSTILSRTRQQLSKRNSGAQSQSIKYKTVKIQTENCSKNNIAVTVEPMDFIGLFEKATNVPTSGQPDTYKNKGTQMYEHITQSELFCIEWIHKNLFEVRLSPNTLVIDDKLRDLSESPCMP